MPHLRMGLYYPYIHFRDDAWLKLAALYWDGVGRIVPDGYHTDDSRTVRILRDELNFVLEVSPQRGALSAASLFMQLLEDRGSEIARALRPSSNVRNDSGDPDTDVGYIFASKLSSPLRSALDSLNLTYQRYPHDPTNGVARHSLQDRPEDWVGVDSRLASVYMCVLTSEIASANRLSPITDQRMAHAAIGTWSPDRVAGLLLGIDGARTNDAHSDLVHKVVHLAISLAVPEGLDRVPVDAIVKFRREHGDEVTAFGQAIDDVVSLMHDFPAEADQAIVRQVLVVEVDKRFAEPKRDLEKALRRSFGTTVRETLNLQAGLPILVPLGAAGLVIDPMIGAVGGTALGIATVAANYRKIRSDLIDANPTASYLLAAEKALGPKSSVLRTLAAIR